MIIPSTSLPGIYLHIPFCIKKCGYCDFYSQTDSALTEEFVRSIIREMQLWGERSGPSGEFDTIYFGGGTPSLLSANQIERILQSIFSLFKISKNAEITLEMNPGTNETGKLSDFHQLGINRLSIGIQSFNLNELRFLERIHTVDETYKCIDTARKNGFENIGLDLIYGLPGQNIKNWRYNLEEAVKLSPEHLSAYHLAIEKNTPFYERMNQGETMHPRDGNSEIMFRETISFLKANGYLPYEISNYAKSLKFISRHNSKYWFHVPYLGFGPSAHSLWDNRRWDNMADLHSYINHVKNDKLPVKRSESLSLKTEEFEQIMLRLRTYQGLELDKFSARFGHQFIQTYSRIVNSMKDLGFAEIENGCFRLTPEGMLLSDEIISNFHN